MPYVKYVVYVSVGKSVISGSQRWEDSTCNESVAYSVFQFDRYARVRWNYYHSCEINSLRTYYARTY
jgi:hypothetical protein